MTTLSIDIPVLETAHLILREPRLSDLDAMIAFGESDRTRFVGGKVAPWQSWNILNAAIGHWITRGFGWWTIEDKASGAVLGRTGIGHAIDFPEPELGWVVHDGFEGRGIAFEAATAARDQAWKMGLGPLISLIAPENLRSRKLAERLGATVEREDFEVRGTPCMIYRHPKGDAA